MAGRINAHEEVLVRHKKVLLFLECLNNIDKQQNIIYKKSRENVSIEDESLYIQF